MLEKPISGPSWYQIPFGGWVCYVGEQHITKQFTLMLQNHVNGQPMAQYWKKWYGLSDNLWHKVDWDGFKQAFSKPQSLNGGGP